MIFYYGAKINKKKIPIKNLQRLLPPAPASLAIA